MRKLHPILLSVSVLLLLSLACAGSGIPAPGVPTEDFNLVGTAVMSTMVAGATQTALAAPPTATVLNSPTPWPTFTPTLASLTFTPSPSATLSATPFFTSTSSVPLISVSVATNCRVGPGRAYARVGALVVGQVAEVFGRSPNGNYWYIRNPNQSNGFCWLWGEYATLTGNFAALPIFTPPPTPTPRPAFDASYETLETCNNNWWVDIRLVNTGGLTFESVTITIRDLDTDRVVSTYSDAFTNLNSCVNSTSRERLGPGAARTVSASPFAYNPTGHRMRATLTLCSRDGLEGMCLAEKIEFTPVRSD